jgi:hypothetical protein
MHFGFMNVILLHSDRHVAATQVSFFRVVSARLLIYAQRVGITPQLKSYIFGTTLLNDKAVTSI